MKPQANPDSLNEIQGQITNPPVGTKSDAPVVLIKNSQSLKHIPIDALDPMAGLPRKHTNLPHLDELTASIRESGIIQPILVRPAETDSARDTYEIIAGVQRFKAAKKAGLATVPAFVRHDISRTDALQHALVEHAGRRDLGPLEETEAIISLLCDMLNKSQKEVVSLIHRVGKQAYGAGNNVIPNPDEAQKVVGLFKSLTKNIGSFRTNALPMLGWPDDVKNAVRQNQISPSKGRIIARFEDADQRKNLIDQAIEEGTTVEEIRRIKREHDGIDDTTLTPEALKKNAETTWAKLQNSDVWTCDDRKEKLVALLRQLNGLIRENSEPASA